MLKNRKTTITDEKSIIRKVTVNKTIIDYAIDFIKLNRKPNRTFQMINHIRLFKQMLLQAELIQMNGRKRTFKQKNYFDKSWIKWKIKFLNITWLLKKLIKIQKEFIEWLSL